MRELNLHTVCEEAHCPNVGECWEHGTATFMILGDVCTRNCAYCAVSHGRPPKYDIEEPSRVAEAIGEMQLQHAVITSVVPSGGTEEPGKAGTTIETIAPSMGVPSCASKTLPAHPS